METATWIDPLTDACWESFLVPPVREERFFDSGMATRCVQPEVDGWYYVRFAGPVGNPKQWLVAHYRAKVVQDDALLWSLYPWHVAGDVSSLKFQRIDLVEWREARTSKIAVPVLLEG